MCAAGRMNPFRAIFWSMRTMFSMTLLYLRPSLLAQSCRSFSYRCWYPCLLLLCTVQWWGEWMVSHHFSKPPCPQHARSGHFHARELPSLLFLRCVLGTHKDQMKQNCLVWNEFIKSLVLKRSFEQHKTYSRLCRYSAVTLILDLVNM